MSCKLTAVLIGLLLCALPAMGWAESWEELRASAGTITSVETDFIQTKHLAILNKPMISKGRLWFQTPDSMRWEYVSPIQSVLLMHQGRIKRFTVDAQTRQFREAPAEGLDAMQVVLEEITQWLKGRFDENTMFAADLQSGGKIVLTPKQTAFSDIIQRIELLLDTQPGRQPGMIRQVLIYESESAYTELSFNRTILNRPIDESIFQKGP